MYGCQSSLPKKLISPQSKYKKVTCTCLYPVSVLLKNKEHFPVSIMEKQNILKNSFPFFPLLPVLWTTLFQHHSVKRATRETNEVYKNTCAFSLNKVSTQTLGVAILKTFNVFLIFYSKKMSWQQRPHSIIPIWQRKLPSISNLQSYKRTMKESNHP